MTLCSTWRAYMVLNTPWTNWSSTKARLHVLTETQKDDLCHEIWAKTYKTLARSPTSNSLNWSNQRLDESFIKNLSKQLQKTFEEGYFLWKGRGPVDITLKVCVQTKQKVSCAYHLNHSLCIDFLGYKKGDFHDITLLSKLVFRLQF